MEAPKLKILTSSQANAVFVVQNEDHTIGNSLRHVLAKHPKTDFVGYSVPHPSETVVNMRLQTKGDANAVEVFSEGVTNLKAVLSTIRQEFRDQNEAFVEEKNATMS